MPLVLQSLLVALQPPETRARHARQPGQEVHLRPVQQGVLVAQLVAGAPQQFPPHWGGEEASLAAAATAERG